MKIAICQLGIHFEQKEKNRISAERFIHEAALSQASLIVFPEMSFTGFSIWRANIKPPVELVVDDLE